MEFDKLKTIIVVDDLPSNFVDGGYGSPTREIRYSFFCKRMKKDFTNIEKFIFILGNGIFEYNYNNEKNGLEILDNNHHIFPNDNCEATELVNQIINYKSNNTLLLLDHKLHNSEDKINLGIELSYNIIRGIHNESDIYSILYSRQKINIGDIPDDIKKMKHFYGVIKWLINAPNDAVCVLTKALKERS